MNRTDRYDFYKELLDLKVTPEQDDAAHYLEAHGQAFCIDFGTENAIDKAEAIYLAWLEDGGGL